MNHHVNEEITTELNRIGGEVKAALDGPIADLQAQYLDIQQKVARRGAAGPELPGDQADELAQIVAADEGFKMVQSGRIKSTTLHLSKSAIHSKTLLSGAGLSGVDRRPDIVVPQLRRLRIRDLLPVLSTSAGVVEYVREDGFTNNAAITAEGALKPESTPNLSVQVAQVVTIAHWVHASKQILSDMPQLNLYLNNRLRHGLLDAEEQQLLLGSGVGNNLLGLFVGAGNYIAPIVITGATKIDVIRLAIGQLENANYESNGIVLSPNDWASIELLKITDGRYIKSDPASANQRTLWGVPVVATTAMPVGSFLVGDFQSCGTLYDRQIPTLDIATEDGDDFVRNLVKLRLEERISLALSLPGALVKGTFA